MSATCIERSYYPSLIVISIASSGEVRPMTPSRIIKNYLSYINFCVSPSSFIANMGVKQKSLDFAVDFPLAAKAVIDSFYVDNGLTGADSIDQAVELYHQLQSLFAKGGFLLRKWHCNEPEVLLHIDPEL